MKLLCEPYQIMPNFIEFPNQWLFLFLRMKTKHSNSEMESLVDRNTGQHMKVQRKSKKINLTGSCQALRAQQQSLSTLTRRNPQRVSAKARARKKSVCKRKDKRKILKLRKHLNSCKTNVKMRRGIEMAQVRVFH